LTARVENIGRTVVDLTFPSACRVTPYFIADELAFSVR
jgi:hypothetical protein